MWTNRALQKDTTDDKETLYSYTLFSTKLNYIIAQTDWYTDKNLALAEVVELEQFATHMRYKLLTIALMFLSIFLPE